MATRVSPRSNASSASSSSTSSSRRPYRNPSFGRNRDNLNSDPWVPDSRSAYATKQQQPRNKGQWSQTSHQAGRRWGDSATRVPANESDSKLGWRSQKQAVDSFSSYLDSGQFQGAHQQLERTYEASPSPPHTSKGQWNCANPREQGFYAQHSGPQSSWERHQPNFTKQNQHVPDKLAHGGYHFSHVNANYNQGYKPSRNTIDNHGSSFSILDCSTPEIRATAASSQQGFRDATVNFNHRSSGDVGKSSQGSRHSSRSVFENGRGVELQRAQGGNNEWPKPSVSPRRLGTKMDSFRPLTIRDGTGQRNDGVASTPRSATNRHWEGIGAVTGRWADECCDDAPQTFQMGAKSVCNSYKVVREYSGGATIGRPNDSNNSGNSLDTVAIRDKWQQNSSRGSNVEVSSDISTLLNSEQGFNVKQGEAGRNRSLVGQKGSFKHSLPMASDHIGSAGNFSNVRVGSHKKASFVGSEGGQEALVPKNQVLPSQADVEVSDDVMLPFIIGTCEDMCPLKEREQRERLRDLAVFERVNRNPSKTSRELAVKKFCRTFTGAKLLSEDVRPLRILWSTLQYLLNLLDDTEFSFDVIHNFLFDRTRAIRQELGMQRIANSQAINMYEEIVRFHILSEHELNQRGSGRHVSDSHLNLQQLSKCLLSLFDLYSLNHNEKPLNEAEFRAYYVLLNLDSNKNHQADSLPVWFRQCPAVLLKSWELKFARAVLRYSWSTS